MPGLSTAQLNRTLKLLPRSWRQPVGLVVALLLIALALYGYLRPVQPPAPTNNQVVRVVDGDTIEVRLDGQNQKVRLIGIDTPEVVDPRQPVQCFGQEASRQAHQLLDGQTIELQADPTQDNKDKYGRLLRYVYLPDHTLVNLLLIQEGYAHEYTYQIPYIYQAQFRQAEQQARQQQKGLWSPDTCDGQTK
jgi:micrococcal nuclease